MYVSALFIRGLVSELERRGLVVAPLLESCGIQGGDVGDLRARIPVGAAEAFARLAIEATGDPALGLEVGMNAPERSLQVLSHLVLSCKTLRQAITRFFQFSDCLLDEAVWDLREKGDLAYFSFVPAIACGTAARMAAESVIAMALRLAQSFAGARRPYEIWFTHEAPSYSERYGFAFPCPVRFSQASNAIVFAREMLDWTQRCSDPVMEAVLADAAHQLLRFHRGDDTRLSERVRSLLKSEPRLQRVDANLVARRLGMAPHVLVRDLADEGITLRRLVDEWRREAACEALRRPGACIRATADRLGFSDASAFHRAFRRWTGQTPFTYMTRMSANLQESA